MSALANHTFIKMNGIGNEIVVVDMRDRPQAITAADARAASQKDGAPYDQLMLIYPPRVDGTDALVRIYNNDGSEAGACGNGEAASSGRPITPQRRRYRSRSE